MEAYPPEYVEHNRPLILLSGLGADVESSSTAADRSGTFLREGGFRIQTGIPPVTGSTADALIHSFETLDTADGQHGFYNSSGKIADGAFRLRRVGRTYTLPPRKAPPPPQSPFDGPLGSGNNQPVPLTLHSTISPLTPSSPLYPDGIFTPLWITKHQTRLPCAFVVFFPLTSDPNTSSLRDNQLKTEINGIRSVFSSTNCKTRLVVVFVCEEGEETPYDLEDRLSIIRRGTGLDSKTSFYLSSASPPKVDEFARNVLGILQSTCVEYYRDLSKHARRKRNRGSPPPPTAAPPSGLSHALSQQGWAVRYELKLGILAEFRQEMDAACRNYESAYEGLFSAEIFESMPSWAPRFNEYRMLADIIATRIIRCLLWTGQVTTSVRSWVNHRDRMRDLIVRRGNGTDGYGWAAWEALWSKAMAQLMNQAPIPALSTGELNDARAGKLGAIYCQPEKAIPIGERVAPWEMLHHQGYWLYKSQKHTQRRRNLAIAIPEEDRPPPGQSPASVIASKAHLYDTYLVPGPYEEFSSAANGASEIIQELIHTLHESIDHFQTRKQVRATERLFLELARSLMVSEQWAAALRVLRPVWESLSWRKEGWPMLVEDIGWTVYECSIKCEDPESVLRTLWELYSSQFSPREHFTYDLQHSLDSLTSTSTRQAVVVDADGSSSPISARFAFVTPEGNVGEKLEGQLVLKSNAQPSSELIRISEIKIVFEGGLRSIRLLADEEDNLDAIDHPIDLSKIQLRDASMSADSTIVQSQATGLVALIGHAGLAISPGQTRAFDLLVIPREAGDARVASIAVILDFDAFNLTSVTSGSNAASSEHYYSKGDKVLSRLVGQDRDVSIAKILPKPPKLEISVRGLRPTYYTNEDVDLQLEFKNREDDDIDLTIDVIVQSAIETDLTASWLDTMEHTTKIAPPIEPSTNASLHVPSRSLGILQRQGLRNLSLALRETVDTARYEVSVRVRYHLVSETETPMSKETILILPFIRPFEANYEFQARLDSQPWPDFFQMPDDRTLSENREAIVEDRVPEGLCQRFLLTSKVASFATEQVYIEEIELLIDGVAGGAACQVKKVSEDDDDDGKAGIKISPQGQIETNFDIVVSKYALADRRQVVLDFMLSIRWRRSTDVAQSTTTTLATPRFAIPMAEPRVLLSTSPLVSHSLEEETTSPVPGLVTIFYTLENPSLHFLTFSLTMESSEDFAFSGPKSTTLSLVPLSRHSVAFRLLATKKNINTKITEGMWLRPNLIVVDQGFRKQLRVIAAGDKVVQDKKGVAVWVD